MFDYALNGTKGYLKGACLVVRGGLFQVVAPLSCIIWSSGKCSPLVQKGYYFHFFHFRELNFSKYILQFWQIPSNVLCIFYVNWTSYPFSTFGDIMALVSHGNPYEPALSCSSSRLLNCALFNDPQTNRRYVTDFIITLVAFEKEMLVPAVRKGLRSICSVIWTDFVVQEIVLSITVVRSLIALPLSGLTLVVHFPELC